MSGGIDPRAQIFGRLDPTVCEPRPVEVEASEPPRPITREIDEVPEGSHRDGGLIRVGAFLVTRLAVREGVATAAVVAERCARAIWQSFAVSRGLVGFEMRQIMPRVFEVTSKTYTGTIKVLKDGSVTFMLRSGQLTEAAKAEMTFLMNQASQRIGSAQGLKWVSEAGEAASKAGPKAFEMLIKKTP